MWRAQVKSLLARQYHVIGESTPIIQSRTGALLCSLERKHTNAGEITQDETFSGLVKADRTVYHLPSSKRAAQSRHSKLSEGLLFS